MSHILTEINDQIAWVTIDRPEALNAMNPTVISELEEAIVTCINDSSVGVIILTGSGEKSFVAGADIKTMQLMGSDEALTFGKVGQQLTVTIENS
jgi:enoyl-CoA hydratase